MKLYSLLYIILLAFSISCNSTDQNDAKSDDPTGSQNSGNEIIITGQLLEYNLDSNNNLLEVIFDDVLEDRINKVSQIDSKGKFSFSLTRPYAQSGMLLVGDNLYSFFVAPGDSLYFEINYAKDEINFKGSHAQFNYQLVSYYKFINDSQDDFDIRDSILRTSEPMEYKAYINKKAAYFARILSDFFKENKCNDEFIAWSSAERKYWLMTELMRYRWLHPYKNKVQRDSFFLTIPKEYFSFLEDPQLIERSGLQTQFFYYFLGEYYSYRLSDIMPKDSTAKMSELYKSGNELASFQMRASQLYTKEPSFTQDLLLARFYQQVLEEGRTTAFDSLVKEHPIDEENLSQLLQLKYEQVKELGKRSGKASSIHFNKGLENVAQGIIDTLVKQHAGKVLYIDFWAPWCGPCMAEVPYAKRLKEQINTEKVAFIYLGVQCGQDSWETTILKKEMEGEHYLLSDEQYKLLAKQFEIKEIPRYLIVDTEGKVVDSKAPKPRESKDLLEVLNSLTSTK